MHVLELENEERIRCYKHFFFECVALKIEIDNSTKLFFV